MANRRGNKLSFALVVLSFVLSTIVSLSSLHVLAKRHERQVNRVLAAQAYDHIMNSVSEPLTVSRTMASDSFIADVLTDENKDAPDATEQSFVRYLSNLEQGLDCENAFVISDATKNYYTARGLIRTVNPTREHDEWYRQLALSDDSYALDVDNDEVDAQDLTVYVNAKVSDGDGKLLGVCGVGVRMTGMQDLFSKLEDEYHVKISLVNPYGLVQVDTNEHSIERESLNSLIQGDTSNGYQYHELGGNRFAITKYLASLDWYLIVQSGDTSEANDFINVIGLNAVLCAVVLVILFIVLRRNQRQTEALAAASLIDSLTSLHNRRAFEEDKDAMAKEPRSSNLACVAADVNGLKTANDTLGHEAGDELIRGAAECLRQCLEPYGTVYRTGGDEFAALIHATADQQFAIEESLSRVMASWSGDLVSSLSMSCGFASAREFPTENVFDLCRIADKRMYEDKTRYYERNGGHRRGA